MKSASVGGIPTVPVDVPVSAVLLCFYAIGSALNMTLFFNNRRRGHKFFISWILNAFCIVRVVTCSMRIAWAVSPTNSHMAIAAQVFNNAGILIIYIVNLIFSQRILRAKQPVIGWNPILSASFKFLYALLIGSLIMGITVLVISTNTTSPSTLQSIRAVSLASTTFIMAVAVLPLLLLAAVCFVPDSSNAETFGVGSMRTKLLIVSISTCLAIVIAGFKTGTTWETPRSASNPAWYHSKEAFYCFNFMLEILILGMFLVTRVDKRFYVPDHCKGPGDYSRLELQRTKN